MSFSGFLFASAKKSKIMLFVGDRTQEIPPHMCTTSLLPLWGAGTTGAGQEGPGWPRLREEKSQGSVWELLQSQRGREFANGAWLSWAKNSIKKTQHTCPLSICGQEALPLMDASLGVGHSYASWTFL